ncbi:MAG TPA: hypothetical protein VLI90_18190, partial [Tepidisphaeraceae bacterium]|nr:hypothetical protein [Tepidisphaeraceae bacterium]
MRRWLLRILIGIAALIVLVVIGVQIVLWTNIPKNLVVKQIESEMGLRISTDSLRTGWLGRSTLQNVALGLPLSDKSFLKVQTLQVKHTTLFGMIFGRAVSIDRIEIDHPEVFVRQDANGNWNLQEVAEILAKVSGGKTAQESQKQGIPRLPDVRLIEGVVHVTDNGDKEATIAPLSIDGHGEGPLVWKFDVKLAKSVAINGEVAPGNTWKHQVRLSAHDLGSLLNSWGVNSYGADLAGTWDGQLGEGGKLRGTFTVDHLKAKSIAAVGDVSVTGAIDVDAGAGSAVTLRPRRIDLKTSNPALNNVWLAAGTITRDSTGIRAQTMQVAALGGLAVLDASFDPRTFAGDLQLRWSGLAVSSGMNHSGSITAKLRMPFPGQPAINVDLLSQGATSSGKWDAKVNVAGIGQSWKSIDWVITAPTLTYTGSHPIQMAQLVAHVTQRWPSVELADMTIPERPHLQARAAADFSTHNWYFWLDAGGVPHPDNVPLPITFLINAWGNADVYTLHELDLQIADAIIWAGGYYDRRKPNPMNLDVVLTRSPQLAIDAPIQGHLGGRFNLSGR